MKDFFLKVAIAIASFIFGVATGGFWERGFDIKRGEIDPAEE